MVGWTTDPARRGKNAMTTVGEEDPEPPRFHAPSTRSAGGQSPDSGLSDYAVSPFGMPAALLGDEVRVAFLGRTSTEDQQDPRQSLIRQLHSCKSAIPASWVIVAHFYDVESGRMELAARGRGENYERFDIPIARDGGVADLLDEAASQASVRRGDLREHLPGCPPRVRGAVDRT